MSISDFYAKICIFLYYQFLICVYLKILTFLQLFAKKCVKPKIGLNGQKMKKQMARSDFYAKICIFFTIDF